MESNITAGGYKWAYYNEQKTPKIKDYKRHRKQYQHRKGYGRKVCSLDRQTNEIIRIYNNADDASKDTGLTKGAIYLAINKTEGHKTAGGFRWAYYAL